jgi:hypothetical protein
MRREAFRSNLFGREILPTDEKLHAAFFHLRNRFQVWIARAKPAAIAIRNAATIGKTIATARRVIARYRGFTCYAPFQYSSAPLVGVSQRFPTSGGAEIDEGKD